MDSPKVYNPPTPFAFVETDSLNLNQAYKRFAVVKTEPPNHKPPAHFALVKTDSLTLYNPPIVIVIVHSNKRST